ncbi:hypothetical protein LOTGIDRAFT_161317 [Lottia gigantea]|uniref:Uncharacterized protein n=1 Tax=Lottia gigantea TaxID=225164 RepID=V4ABD5_LOTGI|nr:hypothetical protein LOTGIDRAFT_161317 [Lottia gigantea]ESO94122.1 hypothetical protein LOTGIDRAFT_161317 [Lottia gigantea]
MSLHRLRFDTDLNCQRREFRNKKKTFRRELWRTDSKIGKLTGRRSWLSIETKKDVGFNTPIPMTTLNSTSTEVISQGQSLLWIPYVVIATVFLGFLGVHFWCYHRKNQEKLSRKLDEKRVKAEIFGEVRNSDLRQKRCVCAEIIKVESKDINKYNGQHSRNSNAISVINCDVIHSPSCEVFYLLYMADPDCQHVHNRFLSSALQRLR